MLVLCYLVLVCRFLVLVLCFLVAAGPTISCGGVPGGAGPVPVFPAAVPGADENCRRQKPFSHRKTCAETFFYRKHMTFLPYGQVGFVQTAPQWLYHFLFMLDFYRTAKGGLWILTVRPRGVCGTFFTEKIQKTNQKKTKKTCSPPLCFRFVNFGPQGTP